MAQVKFRTKSGKLVSFRTGNRRAPARTGARGSARAEYRHEDVAAVPRGWRVRTVSAGEHQVRVAFPPGPRHPGTGRLISVLHPPGENPACNRILHTAKKPTTVYVVRWIHSGLGPQESIPMLDKQLAQEAADEIKQTSTAKQVSVDRIIVRPGEKFIRFTNPLLQSALTGAAMGAAAGATGALLRNQSATFGKKLFLFVGKTAKILRSQYGFPSFLSIKVSDEIVRHFEAGFSPEKSARIIDVKITGRSRGGETSSAIYNRRGNQEADAAAAYKDFHGRSPREVLELQEELLASGDYFALGEMGCLWLRPVEGDPISWPKPDIEFEEKDHVKLAAADETGRQLYLVGGDQEISGDYLRELGLDPGKRFVPLGCLYGISYRTEKNFDKFRTTEYAHELGEETGERPLAVYDQETKRILLVGGAYSIAPLEKELGASPGIVN